MFGAVPPVVEMLKSPADTSPGTPLIVSSIESHPAGFDPSGSKGSRASIAPLGGSLDTIVRAQLLFVSSQQPGEPHGFPLCMLQLPPPQVSDPLQYRPSLQEFELLVFTQWFVDSLQLSVVHEFPSEQFLAAYEHCPVDTLHVSMVQNSPSSQSPLL